MHLGISTYRKCRRNGNYAKNKKKPCRTQGRKFKNIVYSSSEKSSALIADEMISVSNPRVARKQ